MLSSWLIWNRRNFSSDYVFTEVRILSLHLGETGKQCSREKERKDVNRFTWRADWLGQTERANLEAFPAPEAWPVVASRGEGAAAGC